MKEYIINARIDLKNLPDYESVENNMIPTEMSGDAAMTRVIEDRYWYCTERGAATYVGLGQARNKYTMYRETLEVLKSNMPDLMDRVFGTFTRWDKEGDGTPKTKSMISFGIAGGSKEIAILDAFIKCCFRTMPINFVPVELSYPLLLYGLRQVQKRFHDDIAEKFLNIKAAVTDYGRANIDDFVEKGYRFITALGVIHSSLLNESLTAMKKMMDKNTLLLIDVEMIDGRSNEAMCEPYGDIDVKKFIFSPLNLLKEASKRDTGTFKGIELVGDYKRFANVSFKAEDIVTEVVTAETLDEFIEKYDLPGLARRMLRVEEDVGAKTVMIVYAPKDGPAYVLGHSIRFEREGFHTVLKNHGLEIRGEWSEAGAHNTYYLISLKGA